MYQQRYLKNISIDVAGEVGQLGHSWEVKISKLK